MLSSNSFKAIAQIGEVDAHISLYHVYEDLWDFPYMKASVLWNNLNNLWLQSGKHVSDTNP